MNLSRMGVLFGIAAISLYAVSDFIDIHPAAWGIPAYAAFVCLIIPGLTGRS